MTDHFTKAVTDTIVKTLEQHVRSVGESSLKHWRDTGPDAKVKEWEREQCLNPDQIKTSKLGVDQTLITDQIKTTTLPNNRITTDKLYWVQPVCLEVIRADIAEVYAHVIKLQEMETSRGISYNGIINHNVAIHAFNLVLKRYGEWILANTHAKYAELVRPNSTYTAFMLDRYYVRIEYAGKGAKLEKVEVGFPYEEDMEKFKAQFECV